MRQGRRSIRYTQAEMSVQDGSYKTMSAEPSLRMINIIRQRLASIDEAKLGLVLNLPQGRGEPNFIRATLIQALDALEEKMTGRSETRQEL